MVKRKQKIKEHSMIKQLILIPWFILGVIVIGQIFYGIRVAGIVETNALDIRTATLTQYVYGLQSNLDQYKMFVANNTLGTDTLASLASEDELDSYQALQKLEEDWEAAFRLYPEVSGMFLFDGVSFWSMINPLESYENQSGAVLSLKEWANSLNEQANPYPDSWQVLNKEDGEQILFCALREQGHIFGVWVDIEQILREVNRFYDNQYQHIFVNFKESGERQTSSAKSDENIAVTASFEKGNYAIEELTDRRELFWELYQLNYLLAALIIITVTLLGSYMYMNYRRIVQSIHSLIFAMSGTMETGKITLVEKKSTFREFRQLTEIYNRFLTKIDDLEDHIANEKMRFQEIKRQFLELQIRPHFYVNIISGVLGYINSQNLPQAKKLLQCMAAHLSYILYNKDGKARLGDELNFSQNYIEIQKLRFGDFFLIRNEVDTEYQDIMVPVLSLQTFIENSSKYVKRTKQICIRIQAELMEEDEKEYLQVTVSDNGKGFPEEVLTRFNRGQEMYFEGRRHVGIQNLYERMQQLYGNQAEMDLWNRDGGGAVIRWKIPLS